MGKARGQRVPTTAVFCKVHQWKCRAGISNNHILLWQPQYLMRAENLLSDKLQLKMRDPAEPNHCDISFHCLCEHVSKSSYVYWNAVYSLKFQAKYQTKFVSETLGFTLIFRHYNKLPLPVLDISYVLNCLNYILYHPK